MPDNAMFVRAITTAEIVDEIWKEVARNQTDLSSSREALEQATLASLPVPSGALPGAPLPLPALLALDGMAFIDAAYATLLGRLPDEAGIAYMTAELRRGRDKVALLGALQRSEEGRSGGRWIAGLRRRHLVRRAYRVPVVGVLLRFAATALRWSGVSRRLAGRGEATDALRAEFASRLAALTAEIDQRGHDLEKQNAAQQRTIELLTRRLATLQAAQEAATRKASDDRIRWVEHATRLGRNPAVAEDGVIGAVIAVSEELRRHEDWRTEVETIITVSGARAHADAASAKLRTEVEQRMVGVEAMAIEHHRQITDQQQRLHKALATLQADGIEHDAAPPPTGDGHDLDSLYLAFTDRFRGTRTDIKERHRVYLPRLRAAGAGVADRPVLDLGAGRGEFLELLAESHLVASGVDNNAAMAALCRQSGLVCAECDGLAYLQACKDASLGAITSFHVIEHLPFEAVVRLIDEAHRALAPGGLLILETPNPANLLTASHFFYLDPTHRNPMPARMVSMVVEARGFPMPEILELHPMPNRLPGEDRPLVDALDTLFYGPQDYAVIARKA